MFFDEIGFYAKYAGKITCAYQKNHYVDSKGQERCNAQRTKEREKYLFPGLTDDIILIDCPLDIYAQEFELEVEKGGKKLKTTKKQIEAWIEQSYKASLKLGVDSCVVSHGGTSPWFYICNLTHLVEGKERECKKELAKLIIPPEALDFLDLSNFGNTLIPIINRPHWKKIKNEGRIHKIIKGKNPDKHKNKIPESIVQKVLQECKPHIPRDRDYGGSDINNLNITDIVSLSGLKKRDHEYQGPNPWHGSTGGTNFTVDPSQNCWHCFRCGVGGYVKHAIALNEGIIKNCDEKLSDEHFKQVIEIAQTKYGLKPLPALTPIQKQYYSQFQDSQPTSEQEQQEDELFQEALYYHKDMEDYEQPSQKWLMEGIIPSRNIGVLGGYMDSYKTFIGLRLAVSLASGTSFLGIADVPEKLKVLFIDEENGKPEVINRIKAMCKDANIKEDLELACLSFYNSKLDLPNKQKKVLKLIEDFKPDIIILDCLQRVVSFDVDRENQKISDFFTSFVRPTTQKYGCSWLFIHHFRKPNPQVKAINLMDELRGGSELGNYIRFGFGIIKPKKQEQENGEIVIFHHMKNSNAPRISSKIISISGEIKKGEFEMRCEGDAADILKAEQQCAEAIKQWLLEEGIKGNFKTGEVVKAEPGGYKKSTINAGLRILLEEQFLEKPKYGFWKVSGSTSQTIISGIGGAKEK